MELKICVILRYLCKMIHNIHSQVGRVRKYSGRWKNVNKRICISNKTFPKAVDFINKLSLSYMKPIISFKYNTCYIILYEKSLLGLYLG